MLRTGAIERVAGFYAALGRDFIAEQRGSGPAHFAAEAGGLILEIHPTRTPMGAIERGSSADVRLGFVVDDVDDAVGSLLRAGGSLLDRSAPSIGGGTAVVADPDGRRVELREAVSG